jgi:hypothetical protein
VKLQGLTTGGRRRSTRNLEWKRKGALHALLGGQPLQFALEGSLDKVALLTYVTRPCDSTPRMRTPTAISSRVEPIRPNGRGHEHSASAADALASGREPAGARDPQPILEEELPGCEPTASSTSCCCPITSAVATSRRAAERHASRRELVEVSGCGDEALRWPAPLHPASGMCFLRPDCASAKPARAARGPSNFEDHRAMYASLSQEVLRSVVPRLHLCRRSPLSARMNGRRCPASAPTSYEVEPRISGAFEAAKPRR